AAVALVLYGYVGYPVLLALLARRRARAVATAPVTPRVSVVVSVQNGAGVIGPKLENCLALDYPADRLEVLVASDGSTDATNDVVRGWPDARVRLVPTEPRQGKEVAQRRAIEEATGEVLVFTDVGVRVEAAGLRALVANFADPAVGCASGVDRVVNAAGEAVGEGAFVRYETALKLLESRLGSTVGNSGWFFAVRRGLCDEWPAALASDFTMLLRTVKRGFRGVVEPRAVASAVATVSPAREFQRKVRTIVRGLAVLAAHREMLNPLRYGFFAVQLASHKVFRWLLPLPLASILVASAVLATGSRFYLALLAGQVLFYGAGALLPRTRIPHFFVSSSAAAMVAWWKFCMGERFVVWEPTPRTHAAIR
ncbi:MAG TPA: glycosyltransferase family 2 protein, partial [Methylomirabilota bacterium]|nr:glycosyltransferase family 2 protein [Methylomirabilota bacterium]